MNESESPAETSPQKPTRLPYSQEECEDFYRWVIGETLMNKLAPATAREVTKTLDSLHRAIGHRLKLEARAKQIERHLAELRKADAKRTGER